MAKEIELKLAFPPAAQAEIEAHPLIAGAALRGEPKWLDNTYFDTPALNLHSERVAIRVRDTGSELLQTVKCAAASIGGLSIRPEWEQSFSGRFDFERVDAPAVRELLETHRDDLRPVFNTAFRRVTRVVEPRPGACILLMLDVGKIVSEGRECTIHELELELAAGTASDLRDFAIALAAELPLLPFDDSKAQRGYQLFLKESSKPLRAPKAGIRAEQRPRQAFLSLANQGLTCWQANLHGMLAHSDPEFLHQFRVALRRMNTLLRVFKPLLPAGFAQTWSADLKAIASSTGEARDLDVMLDTVLRPMLASGDKVRAKPVKRAIAACETARDAAALGPTRRLDGHTLLRFSRELSLLDSQADDGDFARFAEQRLGDLHRRAMKRFQQVVRSHRAADAHRLRIALKHLRYACEFFAELFDEVEMNQYAREVAGLQDDFGFVNDLYVALARLDGWAAQNGELAEARDYIARWHAGRIDEKFAKALSRADDLLRACLPWCGACERHGFKSARKRIKQGVAVKLG